MDARQSVLILLVEDDVRSGRVLARMLREDGFDVELVTDGAAAIDRLGRAPMPDVLVTDLRLPQVDGLVVARFGRSRDLGLPLIIVTGYPQQAAKAEKEMVPPPVVFTKPFDYPDLSREIHRLVATGTTPAC